MSELLANITIMFMLIIITLFVSRIDKNIIAMRGDQIRVSTDTMILMEWDNEILKYKIKHNKGSKK